MNLELLARSLEDSLESFDDILELDEYLSIHRNINLSTNELISLWMILRRR